MILHLDTGQELVFFAVLFTYVTVYVFSNGVCVKLRGLKGFIS